MKTNSVRVGGAVSVLLAVGLWASACNGNGGTEPPPNGGNQTATIQVTVRADGSGQQGITVRLFASGGNSALATGQTASNGVVSFTELEAGTYETEVAVPAGLELDTGESARKTVSATAGSTATVSFNLVSEEPVDDDAVEIRLTGQNTFEPSNVTVSPGTTIRWINDSAVFHTITPDGHNQWARQEMEDEGQTFEQVLQNTGDFDYFCEPHQGVGMTGTITVQ